MLTKSFILIWILLIVSVKKIHSQENQICTGTWEGMEIEYFSGEIAVKFKNSPFTSDLSRITSLIHGSVSMVDNDLRWAIIKINDTVNVLEVINLIDDDPSIQNAVPKTLGYPHSGTPPNDYYFAGKQWYLKNTGQSGGTVGADIKAVEAWSITLGSQNVIMAILDSGIPLVGNSLSLEHPDLDDTTKIIVGPDVFYPRQNLLYNGDVISQILLHSMGKRL